MIHAVRRTLLATALTVALAGCGKSPTSPEAPSVPPGTRDSTKANAPNPKKAEPAPTAKKSETPKAAPKVEEKEPDFAKLKTPMKGGEVKVLSVGQTADVEGMKVTVTKVSEMTKAEVEKIMRAMEDESPVRDDRFILVHVAIENNTGNDVLVSSGLHMGLKVASGEMAAGSIHGLLASKGKQPDGTLKPKEKWEAVSAWQVPKSAKGFKWVYKTSGQEEIAVFDLKLQ